MAEYTKIKTARTIICDFCNQLYSDEECPNQCDWMDMLEQDAVSVPQWISVKERLPRNYIEVMVFDAISRGMFLGAIGSSGEWEIPGYRTDAFNLTHWMPLPEPPKGENDG